MKKLLFLLLLVTSSLVASTQKYSAYINFAEYQVRSKIGYGPDVSKVKMHDDTDCLVSVQEDFHYYWYFNRYGYCYMHVLIPTSVFYLNQYAQILNRTFSPDGDRRWKAYLAGQTILIELHYLKSEGKDAFYFTKQ